MRSTLKVIYVLGLLFLSLLPSLAYGQCAGVTSCSATNCTANVVADALDSITLDGTTLTLPACSTSWGAQTAHTSPNGRANVNANGRVQFLPINSFTMAGQSTIATTENISGMSNPLTFNDTTNLIYNNSSAGDNLLQVVAHPGKLIRITGITICGFDCGGIGVTTGGAISIVNISASTPCTGTSGACVRVDHVHFKNINNVEMVWGGWNYGVADHNLFDMHYGDSNGLKLTHAQYGSDANNTGSISQNSPDDFGTHGAVAEAIFIENNTAQQTCSTATCGGGSQWIGAINDCSSAGRQVIRYNTFIGSTYVQTHEMEGAGRGCRTTEIYKNYQAANSGPDGTYGCAGCSAQPFHTSRAGISLVWGNTLVGPSTVMNVFNNRDGSHPGSQGAPPNGWGYCGNGTSGQSGTSVWDQNTTSNGYACLDQPGRGQGDLITGNGSPFTNILNATQGNTRVWPRQALDPIYVFNNTWSAQPAGAHYFGTSNTALYAQNRDFYIEIPNFGDASTFNGTVGIGNGTLTPSTSGAYTNAPNCTAGNPANATLYNSGTPGVGYWDTTNQTLYVCTGTNSWTAYYTPYTYPHPLVGPASSPTVTINPTSLNFGSLGVGLTSQPQSFTFTNNGPGTVVISTITVTGDYSQSNNCAFSSPIAVGAGCTINVIFSPTALGTRVGNVTITSTASNSPSVESLTGIGVTTTTIINGTITINGTIITQ